MSGVEQFRLPDLGEGLAEGEIVKWLVGVGDVVTLNQPVVEVETAKAAVEIPARWAGRVVEIFHAAGTTVAVGTPIVAIDTGGTERSTGGSDVAGGAGGRTPVLVGYGPRNAAAGGRRALGGGRSKAPVDGSTAPVDGSTLSPGRPVGPDAGRTAGPALAKPPVRKLARDLGIELRAVRGTGPSGSVTREDLLAHHQAATALPGGAPQASPGRQAAGERRVPVAGVRRRVAENLVASAFTAPHATVFLTVDVTRSVRALDRLRELPRWRGLRVSPLLLVAKGVLLAITRYPMVNSSWAGDEIIVHGEVNLGIAVASDRGLVVPNLKAAGQYSTRGLAEAMATLVAAARDGRASPTDMTGGTFTITNIGVFGVDAGTPILPPGEAAILSVGTVRDAPWVHNGKVKIRKIVTLGLSFDHRIIDGELGSRFLREVGDFLTDPGTWLLAHG